MDLWGITDTGSVRSQNQDYYYMELVEPGVAVAIVCDGMGGAKSGNIASRLAVDTFLSAMRSSPLERWRTEPEAVLASAADQANEVCNAIRATIRHLYGARVARSVTIQYGGSMNPANAAELLAQPDVDGGLIGGAALVPEKFVDIINAANQE